MRSIYRQGAFATAGVVTTPLAGLLWKIGKIAADVKATGVTTAVVFSACAVVAFVTQVVVIGRLSFTTWRERSPWLMLAVTFGVLSLVSHSVVWAGTPGAITRVALPMALGFNVLGEAVILARARPRQSRRRSGRAVVHVPDVTAIADMSSRD